MLNGVTELIMMKADVLDLFKTIKVCVEYEASGEKLDHFPYELTPGLKPVYTELTGWNRDLTDVKKQEDFPPN